MNFVQLLLPLALIGVAPAWARTKSVILKAETVVTVRCALAHSTLLRFDTRPTSLVSGDQDAYKIEYVGANVTIKPLLRGARTNLFVFFGDRSFCFDLTTVDANSDYAISATENTRADRQTIPTAPGQMVLRRADLASDQNGHKLNITGMGNTPSNRALLIRFRFACTKANCCPQVTFDFFQGRSKLTGVRLFMEPRITSEIQSGMAIVRYSSLNAANAVVLSATNRTHIQSVEIPSSMLKARSL